MHFSHDFLFSLFIVLLNVFFFFFAFTLTEVAFNETQWAQNSPIQDALLIYTEVMYPVCVAEYAAANNTASFPFHSHFPFLSLCSPFLSPFLSFLYMPLCFT